MKEGDKKTKFFLAKSSLRKRKNMIEGIKDNSENWLEDIGDIESKLCDYFQGFFTTSQPFMAQVEAAL